MAPHNAERQLTLREKRKEREEEVTEKDALNEPEKKKKKQNVVKRGTQHKSGVPTDDRRPTKSADPAHTINANFKFTLECSGCGLKTSYDGVVAPQGLGSNKQSAHIFRSQGNTVADGAENPGHQNDALTFLSVLASNAATHRLVKHVTMKASQWAQHKERLLTRHDGLRELDEELADYHEHGVEPDEEFTLMHEDLKRKVDTADGYLEQMEATIEDNSDIQVRKNARLYGFTDVSAVAPELSCLPGAFWEVFDQCKRACAELRGLERDLAEHDNQQHQASQDIEDFTKRGVWSALACLSSGADRDDGAPSVRRGDARMLGNQMEVLSDLSVVRKKLLTALGDAKVRKADVEAALNGIAVEALVQARLLCEEQYGSGEESEGQ